MSERYHCVFVETVPLVEIEATLLLARFGVESLLGESQTILDLHPTYEPQKRTVLLDCGTEVGRAFTRLFVGFATREYGATAFRVIRCDRSPDALAI